MFRPVIKANRRKSISKWWALPIVLLIQIAVSGCQIRPDAPAMFDDSQDLTNQKDVVILLHGLWRDASAMRPVETFLTAQGYQVHNLSYPSTEFPIETLVSDILKPAVDAINLGSDQKLHFVTHSMGGILVRYYLKHNQPANLGRVVMIAPPNQGTELANLFKDSDWVDVRRGPAVEQLSNAESSWVRQLGEVNFELGIIAGNYNTNWITDWILPGDDDGVVTVESTKVDNMSDFLTIPEKHYRLRGDEKVLKHAAYFLKYGSFYRLTSI
ncbi:esterase/lipase family protein [Aliiglaciecola sp. M165]|uniref:esterase/lipase family protein n=1 Tax=Aliiglaciecola sp. M165 TaxID=2593649 RepID=UPI001180C685|nr:alpha/beta fold hydrolase [Aliiglaciecola sp. M165]TRY30097.1 alpha/beta fold hydrolase [Aliiglaciecola sp. M165]